ncbi:MAG TPA: PfkB family carbohydrate kinase, partial [Chthoniobacterales bacterium]
MTPARVEEILSRAASKRIVVIGDLMLDEFVWGKVGRISPEAPVPVVEVTGESFYPGGAANVARNLREFIGHTSVIGMFGRDRGGQQLRELLEACNIDTSAAIEDSDFATIVKTRIIARQQQVVRVDRENVRAPSAEQVAAVAERLRDRLPDVDAIIFEDYGKGFLSAALVRQVTAEANSRGKIITVDPNANHPLDWQNVTAVKPNRSEAFHAAGLALRDDADNAA